MGRAPCCDKANVKKGPWSPEEDEKLKEYIDKHGTGGNWIALPQKAGLKRCGKSCRLRWLNYLRPNIKHGEFSDDEDQKICSLFTTIGSRWSIIAAQLPGRTDNDIKNYWNTKLKKKFMGKLFPHPSQNQRKSHQSPNYPSFFPSFFPLYSPQSPTQTSHFTTYENPISLPPSFLNSSANFSSNATPPTILQAQESYVGPMFGGEASSSSDGSCSNQVIRGREHGNYGAPNGENLGLQSFFYDGYSDQKPNGLLYGVESDPVDYSSLEEIKELISTNNICTNLNFFC